MAERKIPRLRTLNECVRLIKLEDPDSGVTYHLLKRWIADDILHAKYVGNKALLDYDELVAVLQNR